MASEEHYDRKQYEEISRFAKIIGISEEEYLYGLHLKNQSVKTILLRDGIGFKEFVKDFHAMLDGMTIYKNAMLAEARNSNDERLLKMVVELLFKASSDPMLLAQMYEHYHLEKDDIDISIDHSSEMQ